VTRPKRGRRPGKSDARARILRSARVLFAERGFRGTTTRAIARRAKCDVALVQYFFAGKERLFAAAIELPVEPGEVASLVASSKAGERLARLHLDHVFVERREAVAALLRAVIGDPSSVPALRGLIEAQLVLPPARALRGKDAKLRAELAGALVVGTFVLRHLVALEPLASAPSAKLVPPLARALDALLQGRRR
jgi:AcrR family transcriptional regulator